MDWVEQYHQLKRTETETKGGPGSGHHGHSGRPGKRGGSLPGKGGGGAGGEAGGSSAETAARDVYSEAQAHEPAITKTIVDSVMANGGEMAGLEHRLKSEESLARKIRGYVEDRGIAAADAKALVKDAVRYTALFDAAEYTERAQAVQNTLAEAGWKPYDHALRNFWPAGDSYDGYNCVFVNDQGFKFELQFHTPESIKVKEQSHKLYAKARELPPGPEYSRLVKQMTDLWGKVKRPAGWEKLAGEVRRWS